MLNQCSGGAGVLGQGPVLKTFEVRKFSFQKVDFKPSRQRSWFSLRSAFTRWTPIAAACYGAYLWNKGITEDVSHLEVQCYSNLLPLRIVSKVFGKIANIELPVSTRAYFYGKYSTWFDVNLDEAITDDFTQYESLATFFTRSLKPGARKIDQNGCLVAPCDGRVLSFGPVTSGRIEQIKGVTYSLEQFFGKNTWSNHAEKVHNKAEKSYFSSNSALMEGVHDNTTNALRDSYKQNDLDLDRSPRDADSYYKTILNDPEKNILHHCVIYLAPGDYHRFHSPCDWIVKFRRHFSGKLLSVNPIIAKLIPGLFCLNERAVYIGNWKHGFFSYTAVGATNVGSIKVYKDEALHTNGLKKKRCDELVLEPKIDFERGEMVGQFDMGSTIVLIFEAPRDFEFYLKAGDSVKMGNELGCFKGVPARSGRKWWF